MSTIRIPDAVIELRTVARANGLALTDEALDKLSRFIHRLLEWNKKINLISRKDEENIWQAHILSSIAPLFLRDFQPQTTIVDIGTGGGLPGVPLAILRPSITFVLVDSIAKKIRALDDIVEKTGLENVTTVCERAEVLARREGYRGSFDYVVSRAVASIRDLLKWGKPFLRTGVRIQGADSSRQFPPGLMILYKGGFLEEEIRQAMIKFKPRSVEVTPLVVRGAAGDGDKKIVIIQP